MKLRNAAIAVILSLGMLFGSACSVITTSPATQSATTNQTTTSQNNIVNKIKDIVTGTTTPDATATAPVATTSLSSTPLPSIADVVAQVKPSVVTINSNVTTNTFGQSVTRQVSVGTGWIISSDGLIVTNNHVAAAAAPNIIVILDDGRALPATIVGADPISDLAVLKIKATNLPAVKLGDSAQMRIGDWVVAIGNSLGEGIRATQGIVSRKDVSIQVEGNQLYGLIETDAAINPGNSGGPLVNMAGEVIGITSAKYQGAEATGYAISIDTASQIINQLATRGKVIYPWLGVGLDSVSPYYVQQYNLSVNKGAIVGQVVSGSPADLAGLKTNDVIISFNGHDVTNVDDLVSAIRAAEVGQDVTIVYVRGKQQITTTAKLVERPSS